MNSPPLYSLIAYKCNSVDSCMGCVQDRFNSEFDSEFMMNRTQLVEKITRIMYADKKNSYGEAEHDFQIVCDGFLVYDDVNGSINNGPLDLYYKSTPEPEQIDADYDAAEALGEQMGADALIIMQESRALVDKRLYDENAAALLKKLVVQKAAQDAAHKKKAEKEAAKEDNERLEYERLQKKFNPNPLNENE